MPGFKYRRKAIRLRGYDYSQAGEYFVTICTKDREHIIRDERSLERIREYIVSNPERWVADENSLEHGAMNEFSSWIIQEGLKSPRLSSSTSKQ